jgi:calcineurin-like phosphoesterase family protein
MNIFKTHTVVSTKRVYSRELKVKGDRAYIIPISDTHFGHVNCDTDRLVSFLNLINNMDDCYTIFLGDQTETATKTSIGRSLFDEEFHVEEQMDKLYDLLKPLARNDKILGMIPGNHENRINQMIGMNIAASLARTLDIPYLGYQGYLDLKVGNSEYFVAVHHGSGGGRTNGAKVNSAERLGSITIADLYLSGHSHARSVTNDIIYEFKDGSLVGRNRYYVICGSFLGYWDGYAEMQALRPSDIGAVYIELMSNVKNINVVI